ncbi:MAG: hypothetical protein AB1505_08355 [Candidatus Latescibacterota bacterium]
MGQPVEVNLSIQPTQRFEVVDVAHLVREQTDDALGSRRKAAYCSLHTTAGYLEQGACARLGRSSLEVVPFIKAVQTLFPPDAGYHHDRLELRSELTESEREREPVNADSHLTFMGAGLKNCVTYLNRPHEPVYFIELDGIYRERRRHRRTTVVGYDHDEVVHRDRIAVPVPSEHMIDSINLKDPRHGLFERLEERLREHGVEKGRVDIRLAPEERHVGLTVNEYETLLMRNDLPEALRDPLRYAMRRGRNLLRNPGAIPEKTLNYAIYDLIHLYNELLDTVPVGRGVIDRIVSALSSPASRVLRLKRHISMLVSASSVVGPGRIVQGRYQSPILVQHQPAAGGVRRLDVTIRQFV